MKTVYYINRISHERGVTTVTNHLVEELGKNDHIVCEATYGDGGEYPNYKDVSFFIERKGKAIINDCRPF